MAELKESKARGWLSTAGPWLIMMLLIIAAATLAPILLDLLDFWPLLHGWSENAL